MLEVTKNISLNLIVTNTGQIEGLPKNPRLIKNERYDKLKQSITEDPEMLELRELIVYPVNGKFVTIAGNMRLKVMQELKFKEAPCKVLAAETPIEKLMAYVAKDNIPYGEWDWDALANEWDEDELSDWGLELPTGWGDNEIVSNSSDQIDEELSAIVIVAYNNINDLDKITSFYELDQIDMSDKIKEQLSSQRKAYVFKE